MFKQELIKTLRSPKGIGIFLYFLFAALGDNILGLSQTGKNGALFEIHPAYLSLLSGQSGLVFYALFIWILPIPLMILYCDKYVNERKRNITNIYLTKATRSKVFFSKISVSFLLPGIYCGIPLLVNLLISILFAHNGTSFFGLESIEIDDFGRFLYFGVHHPYIMWFGYFAVALIVFGLLGIMCQCVAMIIKENKIATIVSFAIWMSLFCSKYNITMMIQPYTEYDYSYGLKTALLFCPFVIIAFAGAYILTVVKKDAV